MASSMIGARLNSEVVERLQKRAEAEGKKVSDVVRELIISGLARSSNTGDGVAGIEMVAQLERLDKQLQHFVWRRHQTNAE